MDKCREEFEKKLKCQDLLSELTFCEKTSSYEGDILPTNLATINGAYWAWVKRQAEMDEQQAKVEEQAQEIANLKSLIQGHELRHQQNLSIKQKLTRRSEELQKRVDGALKETQYALQYVEGDMRGNHEFLQMAMIRTFKALEQVLNGGEPK
ncbi:hypothetical protein OHW60_17840 [Acinetobacter baumannii]|nr:hypothetical protein [Acinetobacter baumannii]